MAPVHSKQIVFADGDDTIMVEAVVVLLKRGVDVDDVFRMVRSSDWNWENGAIPVNIASNRNLYDRIVKLAQKRGRNVFASSSYKNRFKRIMDDIQGIEHIIRERAYLFTTENTKEHFRELYHKWHSERSHRNCRGRSRGGNGAISVGGMSLPIFDILTERDDTDDNGQSMDNLSDGEGERSVVMVDDEKTGGNGNPTILNQRQPEEKNRLLNSAERQAIVKTIAELLRVYSHQDVLDMVMQEDWTDGSNLHAEIALRAQIKAYGPGKPYQKYWKKKVVPLMLTWNGKINPCAFRTDAPPVYLHERDLLAVRDFVGEFRNTFLAV